MSKVILQLKDLSKTFFQNTLQERKGLDHFNLTLNEGDFGVIVGGNGAGKSTLMNIIAGKLNLDQGQIILDDVELTNLKDYQRAKWLSRVPQDPSLGTAPRMTLLQNMAIASKRGQKRNFTFSVCDKDIAFYRACLKELGLGLEERLELPMEYLSGGQRQAVTLLMATLADSKLLLLDEHTAALDPKTQRLVMQLTEKLIKKKKLTTLMITHSLTDAITYGNRLFILSQGKLFRKFDAEEKAKLTAEDLFRSLEKSNEMLL